MITMADTFVYLSNNAPISSKEKVSHRFGDNLVKQNSNEEDDE